MLNARNSIRLKFETQSMGSDLCFATPLAYDRDPCEDTERSETTFRRAVVNVDVHVRRGSNSEDTQMEESADPSVVGEFHAEQDAKIVN